jgi:hypothetical protein
MVVIRSAFSVGVASFLILWAFQRIGRGQPSEGQQKPVRAEAKREVDYGPAQGVVVHAESSNQQEQSKSQVIVDEGPASPAYANFCRVTGTPEEVILDFGVNPQPFASGEQHVKGNQRIVVNFYTAKRLKIALEMTIQRHEQTFGAIELDVRRRAKSSQREHGSDIRK